MGLKIIFISTYILCLTLISTANVQVWNCSAGNYIVDGSGKSLYIFTDDTNSTSTCYGSCATNWPPVYLNSTSLTGLTGIANGILGSTTRNDTSVQVTISGRPVYYFISDQNAGDIKGQNVAGKWYIVSPNGMFINSTITGSGNAITPITIKTGSSYLSFGIYLIISTLFILF